MIKLRSLTHPSAKILPAASQPLLLIMLQVAAFMVAAEARVIVALLPALAADLHSTLAGAGLLITTYALPYGLFQLIYGPLADRFSRQRVLAIALGLFALGTFCSGFAPNMAVLLALRVCTGAAAAGVVPVALAYIGDTVPYAERQAALGRMVGMVAFAGVISAALGGVVAEFVSWRVLFLAYGALALLVALLLLWLPLVSSQSQRVRAGSLLAPYRAVLARGGRGGLAFYTLMLVEGIAATGTFGYLGALLVTRDHLSYGVSGALLTLTGVGLRRPARAAGRLVARLGEARMVWLGGTLMTIAYPLVALQPVFLWFPPAMLLSGAGFAMAHSTLQTRATELAPEQRGTTVALFAFAFVLGSGLGTAAAGQAIAWVGFTPTLLATAALLAFFTVATGSLLRARPRN
jgi:predicted MFS family arabinose efflux permease